MSISYSTLQNRANLERARADNAVTPVQILLGELNAGATGAEYSARIANLRSFLDSVRTQNTRILADIPQSSGTAGENQALQNFVLQTNEQLDSLELQLNQAQAQLVENTQEQQTRNDLARNSAADEVDQAKNARDDDALTQNPPATRTTINDDGTTVSVNPSTSQPTNARETQISNDSDLGNQNGASTVGGNQATRTSRQTQSGESALNDDAVSDSRQSLGVTSNGDGRPTIAPDFLNEIVPTENPLSGLVTQTYSISIYLINSGDYEEMLLQQRKVLPTSSQLIIQSGGIPFGERNAWFLEDFYIEDVEFKSIVGTQGVGSPHNVATLDFTILEPQGITFLNRLNNAVKRHTGLEKTNELNQNYLMVIRFYGYDEAGNLISGTNLGTSADVSDPRSLVEKFIPFQFADLSYKIGTKAVEYRVQCTIPQTNIGFSQARATIPFNMQLVAPDVQTLLNGNLLLSGTGADPENTTPGTTRFTGATVSQGLCEALNEHQRLLATKGGYKHPDIYEIVLEDVAGLRDAKLAKPGKQIKKRAPMNTSTDPANKFLASKTVYDKDSKTYNITAGTQIVQLIDLVMRSSSYVTSQQNIIFDEKTGEIRNQTPVRTVQWYRVRCQVTPYAYDENRNDYAYRIKYTISRYQINTPRSAYFPPAAYRGVHKLYNYWFTGENTEVVDFEINVRANYLTIIGNDGLVDNSASGRWFEKRTFQTRPNASSQGGEGESTMPAASLSSRLYNMVDVADAELTIVGDPDWLQQSEVFYNQDVTLSPFMPDGSVNYDASEVLYEIRFNPVTDYNIETGLTPTYDFNVERTTQNGEQINLPQESIVWAAAEVHNYFKEGKFTQKLIGTIRDFAGAVDKIGGTSARSSVNPNPPVSDSAPTTPKVSPKESGGPTVSSVAQGSVNQDVAGGTATDSNVGFFDNIADDDAGDQIIFSP